MHRAHDWAVERGDQVRHAPREFPEYHPGYYATFLVGGQGFTLEVVCHHDEGIDPAMSAGPR